MQTRRPSFSLLSRAVSALLGVALISSVSACAAPRIEGRAESEQSMSTCERFLSTAQSHSNIVSNNNIPLLVRYQFADFEQHDWLNVAMQCPAQLSEATMRSAQAQHSARMLANYFGFSYTPLTVTQLDATNSISLPDESLAQLALAEDRAGFATEVLAGRYASTQIPTDTAFVKQLANDGTLLTLSDEHKEVASRMMTLAQGAQDLRRKVYDTQQLTANPVATTDAANGIRSHTAAILEISCAREELQALGKLPTSDIAKAQKDSSDALLQFVLLIATHATTAFDLGYPSADYALFAQ